MPPPRFFIWLASSSSTRRDASFTAARIKSCSISWSLLAKTSGSIFTSTICFWPFILTLTMPPPAEASTVTEFTCLCRSSCSCRNRESICCRAPTSIPSPSYCTSLLFLSRSHFGDFTTESLHHRPYQWVAFELRAQFLGAGGARCSRCADGTKSTTDSHAAAQHVARNGTDLFQRFSSFD